MLTYSQIEITFADALIRIEGSANAATARLLQAILFDPTLQNCVIRPASDNLLPYVESEGSA